MSEIIEFITGYARHNHGKPPGCMSWACRSCGDASPALSFGVEDDARDIIAHLAATLDQSGWKGMVGAA